MGCSSSHVVETTSNLRSLPRGKYSEFNPQPIHAHAHSSPQYASPAIVDLRDHIAAHLHEVWARHKIEQGWSFDVSRDDDLKTHPALIEFPLLTTEEQAQDMLIVLATLKALFSLGYEVEEPADPAHFSCSTAVLELDPDIYCLSNGYIPRPLDLAHITIPEEIAQHLPLFGENTHNMWARDRLDSGWRYGTTSHQTGSVKFSPLLRPWHTLSAREKQPSMTSAEECLKAIYVLGFSIVPKGTRKYSTISNQKAEGTALLDVNIAPLVTENLTHRGKDPATRAEKRFRRRLSRHNSMKQTPQSSHVADKKGSTGNKNASIVEGQMNGSGIERQTLSPVKSQRLEEHEQEESEAEEEKEAEQVTQPKQNLATEQDKAGLLEQAYQPSLQESLGKKHQERGGQRQQQPQLEEKSPPPALSIPPPPQQPPQLQPQQKPTDDAPSDAEPPDLSDDSDECDDDRDISSDDSDVEPMLLTASSRVPSGQLEWEDPNPDVEELVHANVLAATIQRAVTILETPSNDFQQSTRQTHDSEHVDVDVHNQKNEKAHPLPSTIEEQAEDSQARQEKEMEGDLPVLDDTLSAPSRVTSSSKPPTAFALDTRSAKQHPFDPQLTPLADDDYTGPCGRGNLKLDKSGDIVSPLLRNEPKRATASSWVTLYVFISSCFNDMHGERNVLIRKVFPALNSLLESRRVQLIPLDMRWGITPELAESVGATKICLEQITQSSFFLGLLGERYGWIPDAYRLPMEGQEFDFLPLFAGRSITHLEMYYGVLRAQKPATRRAFFFKRSNSYLKQKDFRKQSEVIKQPYLPCAEPDCSLRNELLDQIESFEPATEYTATWDECLKRLTPDDNFANSIIQQIWTAMQDMFPSVISGELSQLEILQQAHDNHCQYLTRHFLGRSDIVAELLSFLKQATTAKPSPQPLSHCTRVLVGTAGAGKSCVAGQVVKQLHAEGPDTRHTKDGVLVLNHFVGAAPESTTIDLVLQRLCLDLAQEYGTYFTEHIDNIKKGMKLEAVDRKYPQERICVATIDEIDLKRNDPLHIHLEPFTEKATSGEFAHDYWSRPGAAHLFPVGYCAKHGRELVPPHGSASSFDWDSYLTITNSSAVSEKFLLHTSRVSDDYEELIETFGQLLEKVCTVQNKPVVLVMDAINQLDDTYQASSLDWLPTHVPGSFRLLMTTLEGDCLGSCRRLGLPTIDLKPLTMNERRDIVHQTLEVHHKALQKQGIDALLTKQDASIPLYLVTACNELVVTGVWDKILTQISSLPETTTSLIDAVFGRLETDHTPELIRQTVCLLYCARNGLLVSELLQLLGTKDAHGEITPLPLALWSPMYHSLAPFLRPISEQGNRGEGTLDFCHRQVAKSVRKRYLSDVSLDPGAERPETPFHRALASFFYELAFVESRKFQGGVFPRSWRELPFHQRLSQQHNDALVVTRVRPFDKRELRNASTRIIKMRGQKTFIKNLRDGTDKMFTFNYSLWSHDRRHGVHVNQAMLFGIAGMDILAHAFDGYNVCLLAYGQTGSGKTYTMYGPENTPSERGLIPRILREMYRRIANNRDPNVQFRLQAAFVEVYGNVARDMLHKKSVISITEEGDSITLQGGSWHELDSLKKIKHFLAVGMRSRTVAPTTMNKVSSRAHTVLQLRLSQTITEHLDDNATRTMEKVSKINLVDLAGSERVATMGEDYTKERQEEGSAINLSLTALNKCIMALANNNNPSKKKMHVPYRNRKLTHLLKECLGGNSRIVMVANVSPADINFEETMSTLQYADITRSLRRPIITPKDLPEKIDSKELSPTLLLERLWKCSSHTVLIETEQRLWGGHNPGAKCFHNPNSILQKGGLIDKMMVALFARIASAGDTTTSYEVDMSVVNIGEVVDKGDSVVYDMLKMLDDIPTLDEHRRFLNAETKVVENFDKYRGLVCLSRRPMRFRGIQRIKPLFTARTILLEAANTPAVKKLILQSRAKSRGVQLHPVLRKVVLTLMSKLPSGRQIQDIATEYGNFELPVTEETAMIQEVMRKIALDSGPNFDFVATLVVKYEPGVPSSDVNLGWLKKIDRMAGPAAVALQRFVEFYGQGYFNPMRKESDFWSAKPPDSVNVRVAGEPAHTLPYSATFDYTVLVSLSSAPSRNFWWLR
eukprot:m.246267 g.246267  ORF g.246267 m.246267 type:complete len:2128 (-) comp26644_c0_seq4:915-7298(-)